jgi:hypothetical protein
MDQLPGRTTLRDLGTHRLKDLGRAEHVYQLVQPGLADEIPAPATIDSRRDNLPTQASTFIGRETELNQIRKRLEDDAVRLLTLTGPGGTGKTRLSLRVAADEVDNFPDGVFFVDLSPSATRAWCSSLSLGPPARVRRPTSRCSTSSGSSSSSDESCWCWTTSST